MTGMDDIENKLSDADKQAAKEAMENITSQEATTVQDNMQESPPPENNSDTNTNEDPLLDRRIDAIDKGGNMEKQELSDSPDQSSNEASTQMDSIEAPQSDISGAEHAGTVSQAPEQGHER